MYMYFQNIANIFNFNFLIFISGLKLDKITKELVESLEYSQFYFTNTIGNIFTYFYSYPTDR